MKMRIVSDFRLRGLLLALLVVLFAGGLRLLAAKAYVAPRPNAANSYPAHDRHPQEKVTAAADPYDTSEKAEIFSLPYKERGLLPIYLIITNEGDQPISLVNMKIQLDTGRRDKISPADSDDLFRRFSHTVRAAESQGRTPFPNPFPRGPKGSVSSEGRDEIQNAPFRARAVEPGGTQAGFLFFDVSESDHPLRGAHLYLTGVKDNGGQELMFFDIDLQKYLDQSPAQSH